MQWLSLQAPTGSRRSPGDLPEALARVPVEAGVGRDARHAVLPHTIVQTCAIHLIGGHAALRLPHVPDQLACDMGAI